MSLISNCEAGELKYLLEKCVHLIISKVRAVYQMLFDTSVSPLVLDNSMPKAPKIDCALFRVLI